ncbi:MAG: META domain-containing protein [Bacteroidota bacterium]|nr:MAG: META domain-containing protein [Bacteroidota bacterium]
MDELFPRGVPEIIVDAEAYTVSGSTGCNRMNGVCRWEQQRITFSQLVTTKMACKGGERPCFWKHCSASINTIFKRYVDASNGNPHNDAFYS